MSYILRLPPIFTAPSEEGKIEQIRTYLYQTIKDIEFSLNAIDSTAEYTVEARETDAASMFAVIKPLIIKSGDILNTYYTIIRDRLDSVYVSQADYNKHTAVDGSINTFAERCTDEITNIVTDNKTTDIPSEFGESVGAIHKVLNKTFIMITDISTGKMASKTLINNVWTSWKVISPGE